MPRLSPGDTAPTFTLTSDEGTSVSSKSLRGQRYVLYFYPADDTPGCTKEACQFSELAETFRASKIRIIGVSANSLKEHRAFRDKYALTITLLSDPDHSVMAAYGAYGKKQLYGKTVVGVIRSTFVIDKSGAIEHAWYSVRADGHARRVLAELA